MSTYNVVLYPGIPLAQAHPNRLATLATLHGIGPADVSGARILELGCGDGTNLLAVAAQLPASQCVGVDLAEAGIEAGRQAAAALGLSNLQLQCLDLLEIGPEFGQFDYVIAHGLYSWVPEGVRDKLLSICRQNLAPHGVAYVSYNTYPGAHLRNMVRDMMRFHVQQFTDIPQKLEQARALSQFIAEYAVTNDDVYPQVIRKEAARIATYRDSSLFHDDLSDCNVPVHFHEFMAHAERHGLQYLSEAHYFEMHAITLAPQAMETLEQMSANLVAREQYLDYLKGRRFRQTLLCHAAAKLDRPPKPERVFDCAVGAPLRPGAVEVSTDSRHAITFVGPKRQSMKTDDPLLQSAFTVLGSAWPRTLPFARLVAEARSHLANQRCQVDERSGAEQELVLGNALLHAYAANLAELHRYPPQFTLDISERPRAFPFARWQIERQTHIANLRHYSILVEDELAQVVLRLLDGTRDREGLVDAVWRMEGFSVTQGGEPAGDIGAARTALAERIEGVLQEFAQQSLLIS